MHEKKNLLFVSHDDNINNKLIKQWNLQTTIETATTTTNDAISPFVLIIWKPLLFSETYMRHGDVQELLAIIYTYVRIMCRKYLHITVGVLRNYIFAILERCTTAHWTYSFRMNIYSEIFLLLQVNVPTTKFPQALHTYSSFLALGCMIRIAEYSI